MKFLTWLARYMGRMLAYLVVSIAAIILILLALGKLATELRDPAYIQLNRSIHDATSTPQATGSQGSSDCYHLLEGGDSSR